jgi:hypothetical protein
VARSGAGRARSSQLQCPGEQWCEQQPHLKHGLCPSALSVPAGLVLGDGAIRSRGEHFAKAAVSGGGGGGAARAGSRIGPALAQHACRALQGLKIGRGVTLLQALCCLVAVVVAVAGDSRLCAVCCAAVQVSDSGDSGGCSCSLRPGPRVCDCPACVCHSVPPSCTYMLQWRMRSSQL